MLDYREDGALVGRAPGAGFCSGPLAGAGLGGLVRAVAAVARSAQGGGRRPEWRVPG